MPAPTGNVLSQTLTPELFAQIKQIQLRTQYLVTEVLAGDYESAFKGQGMEFEHVREYQPGDDIRRIDWNVTARLGSPFVKVHRDERELTVMLAVDLSASGAFGSSRKFKNEVAAEVAAILAYTAIRSHDRVGLVIFTDRVEHFVPPKKGRAHTWQVIREILTFAAQGRGTDIPIALDYLGRVLCRRAVIFLISDFLADNYGPALRACAQRHDVTAVTITDVRETSLPSVGLVELEDAENGEHRLIDTSQAATREAIQSISHTLRRERDRILRSAGVGEISIRTDCPYVEPIVRFFRAREHGRIRRRGRR
jgi:uncharacterized protein (DUF58 family)